MHEIPVINFSYSDLGCIGWFDVHQRLDNAGDRQVLWIEVTSRSLAFTHGATDICGGQQRLDTLVPQIIASFEHF